jgi:hypothetical protein
MAALISFWLNVVASLFKSKSRLEAENAALRHQPIVLQRKVRGRVPFTNSDRLFFMQLYRWFPSVLPSKACLDQRNTAPDGRMDRTANYRGLPLE